MTEDPLNTKRSTSWGVRLFTDWLKEQGLPTEFENLRKENLDKLLGRLYIEARNKKGETYSKSALICLRAAIQRHLEYGPWNVNYVIMTDPAFAHSNRVMQDLFEIMTAEGSDRKSHCPLDRRDFQRLVQTGTVGTHNPRALQNLVFISIALHFGKRDKNGWRDMSKDDFIHIIDDENDVCLEYKGSEKQIKGRMYARLNDPFCPVSAFDKYRSLLHPKIDELWQRPNDSFKAEQHWYDRQVIGKNTLLNMMKKMSLQAGLKRVHTTQCIHATTSMILADAGVDHSESVEVVGLRGTRNRSMEDIKKANSTVKELIRRSRSYVLSSVFDVQDLPQETEKETQSSEPTRNQEENSGSDCDSEDDKTSNDELVMAIKTEEEEEEDPLSIPSTPDSDSAAVPSKRPRLEAQEVQRKETNHRNDNKVMDELDSSEEVFIKCEEVKEEVPSTPSTSENRPLECTGRKESISQNTQKPRFATSSRFSSNSRPLEYTGRKETVGQRLHNVQISTESTTATESPKRKSSNETWNASRMRDQDMYHVFGMHIAKTLRDIDDESTFRQVKIRFNDILLEALAGHFRCTDNNSPTKILLPVNHNPQIMILPNNSQSSKLPNNSQMIVIPNNSQNAQRIILPNNSQSSVIPTGTGSSFVYLNMDPGQVAQNPPMSESSISVNNK